MFTLFLYRVFSIKNTIKLITLTLVLSSFVLPCRADNSSAKEQINGLLDMLEHRKNQIEQRLGTGTPEKPADTTESDTEQALNNLSIPVASAYKAGVRDPFSITRFLAERANIKSTPQSHESGNTHQRFNATEGSFSLPKLKLQGVVLRKGETSPLALLDIVGDGVHMVRMGDEIAFNPADPKQVLKIKTINRLSVIVEVGTLGDLIVVR